MTKAAFDKIAEGLNDALVIAKGNEMTEIISTAALIARLRYFAPVSKVDSLRAWAKDRIEAADALDAQAAEIAALRAELDALKAPIEDEIMGDAISDAMHEPCEKCVSAIMGAISPMIRAREAAAWEKARQMVLHSLATDPVRTGDADDYAEAILAMANPYGQSPNGQ